MKLKTIMENKNRQLKDIIKPHLRKRINGSNIPIFLPKLHGNIKSQAEIWSKKSYKVDPRTYIFTTIQERFGNRLIKKFELGEGAVVVDIGCFIGEKLWQLKKEKDYLGVGVDIAIPALKAAAQIDIFKHKFIAADMEKLPFKDKSVDLCLVFDVIEHLTNVKAGFSEISRVLKPGGKLLLHIPIKNNRYSLFWWKQKILPESAMKDYLDVGHAPERMLTSKQVRSYLNKNHLKVEKEIYYNSLFVHFWDREFFKLLVLLFEKILHSEKIISNNSQTIQEAKSKKGRILYGKYILPFLELLSWPDWILSRLKIGNTYFVIAGKN